MKHLIATALIALAPAFAFANATAEEAPTKTISCSFTEPFFSLQVDLEKKVMTITEPDWEKENVPPKTSIVAENITLAHDFRDPLVPHYSIVREDGEVMLDFTLNMQGSDGMSDLIFPFDARYLEQWGGCESDKIKAHDPHAQ